MNPLHLSTRLQSTLQNYLTTIFDVNRDGNEPDLAAAIADSFDTPGALSRGPYLEITPPYQTGATLQGLVEDNVLSDRFQHLEKHQFPLPPDMPLYRHQERAIRQIITQQRNIVVSSGTGSGKTESFLIPILNDLLLDPSPGVRALLIYPLNALVNDQLDRLRRLLRGTNITFGRYTSELETLLKYGREKNPDAPPNEIIAREQIRDEGKLPQILITNYAMLEYLLLRPEDSALFNSGLWRFVVLDEAHTYAGAQGIEVGMLLRRLKQRLGKQPGDMRCIATSATLTDDDAGEAVAFAKNLFGELFDTDDIIFGEINPDYVQSEDVYTVSPEHYLTDNFQQLLDVIRSGEFDTDTIALLMQESGVLPPDKDWSDLANTYQDHPRRFVWEILRDNRHLIDLREHMLERGQPLSIPDAADVIFNNIPGYFTNDDKHLALQRLVELGASARLDDDEPPLLPARYHMFMRSPQGVWLCLNPDCSGRPENAKTDWSQVFSTRRDTCPDCGCYVYPIKICRECGQIFVEMKHHNGQYIPEPEPDDNHQHLDYKTRYIIWNSEIHENRALGADTFDPEEDDSPTNTDTDTSSEYSTEPITLCLCCGKKTRQNKCTCDPDEAVHTTLYILTKKNKKRRGKKNPPYDFLKQCPRCRSDAQPDTEIATTINLSGTGPLATLTYELYRELPEAQDEELRLKPGGGRKLLTFYDSRQGAARFASYLQDIVNSDNYTHILPQAVQHLTELENMLPSINMLSEQALDDAIQHRLFHNDPTSEQWRGRDFISRQDKTTLKKKIQTRIMAEFTMRRRRRQSLESLGLVAVRYFRTHDAPPGMDTTALAETIGLSSEQTQTLIAYLLDDLRNRKLISLPPGVKADNPSFGRYRGHPHLVRGDASTHKHQEAWIAKTNRHYRRQYVQQVLQDNQLPATDQAIKDTLNALFDWLIAEDNILMTGDAVSGYRLDYNQLMLEHGGTWYRCSSCQRLYAHGGNLLCPHRDCHGIPQHIEDIRQTQSDNFFYNSFDREVVPIRVEEHTAQLAPGKGRKYQDMFRRGDINLLSCSTTFEMGIDLGDLQAIVMSNVPPTVANYQQRAGRAGRRASGTAFILTWASGRPHDQAHFRQPPGIIQGAVRVPYIAVDNPFIRQRHVNAILLSEFLRYRQQQGATEWKYLKAFFDDQYTDTPHIQYLDDWLTTCETDVIRQLKDFAQGFSAFSYQAEWLSVFRQDMNNAHDGYKKQADYYREQKNLLLQKMMADQSTTQTHMTEVKKYDKLLSRLREERLINYLSNEGVLPSYSFPLHSVELALPVSANENNLRLQRDLKIAIREYAPGSEIVADKRIWRSDGVRFYRDTVRDIEYHICDTCNHLKKADVAGKAIHRGPCEICGQPPKRGQQVQRYIIPDGFFSGGSNNGQAARQYVHTQPSLMRSSLYFSRKLDREQLSEMISFAYHRDGELLYVNEGDPRQQRSGGFYIHLADDEKQGQLATTKAERKKLDPVALGHERRTDTLHLYFQSSDTVTLPAPNDTTFWLSLMYALIQGASHALQIERRDIDAVLHPRKVPNSNEWEQTIVLYDDVPGGAGHVKQIQQEFKAVVQAALSIASCTDCAPETSCYHCLRDYNNQYYHYLLKRGKIIRYLEALLNSLTTETYNMPGTVAVVAIDTPLWLLQQVKQTRSKLRLALPKLPADAPAGSRQTWMDVLLNLCQRGIPVELNLTDIPAGNDVDSLSQARYLQVLIKRGLRLQEIQTLPDWHILIDVHDEQTGRAIRFTDGVHLNQKDSKLLTTTQTDALQNVEQIINSVQKRTVQTNDLNPPPGVQVINYDPYQMPTCKTEQDFFADLFQTPVKKLYINDRYLYDRERLVERAGTYIQMAAEQGELQQVTIDTTDADNYRGNHESQNRAIQALKRTFPEIQIDVRRKGAEHDRYITLTRVDGTQARIIIGQGLDFIQSSGRNKPTYIVIQNPIKE